MKKKFDDNMRAMIMQDVISGATQISIANKFNVSTTTVRRVQVEYEQRNARKEPPPLPVYQSSLIRPFTREQLMSGRASPYRAD